MSRSGAGGLRRWLGLLGVIAVLATACVRDSDELEVGAGPAATVATAGGASSGGGGGGRGGDETALAQGGFGDLTNVCQDGDAKGSTDQGVTDTEIKVGTISDKGAPIRPGLNKELYDTAVAFTSWCNERGGINGRTLSLTDLDAKLFEYPAVITKGCQEDFALVGGGAALDDGDNGARVACGLPNIAGYTISAKARAGDLQVQPIPVPVDRNPVGAFRVLAEVDPQAIKRFGTLTGDLSSIVIAKDADVEAVTQLGYEVVFDRRYGAAGESNWRPFVEDMKAKDVQVLEFIGEPENLTALQKAMQTVGWYPKYTLQQANFYDQKYATEGGPTADNTYVRLVFHPFEMAGDNKATQDFLDLMEQYNPSGKVALLGAQGLSAWLLFARAAGACGSELTRTCLIEEARAIRSWTGGGLHGETNPGALEPPSCFLAMKLEAGTFVYDEEMTGPNEGLFNCDPQNVAVLRNDYGVPPPRR